MTGVHTTASDSGLKAVQNERVQSFLCLLGPEQLSNPRRSSGLRMNHASGIQLLSVFATANEESRDSCTRTWRIPVQASFADFSARASKKLPGSQGLEKLSSRQRQRRERPERQRLAGERPRTESSRPTAAHTARQRQSSSGAQLPDASFAAAGKSKEARPVCPVINARCGQSASRKLVHRSSKVHSK